MDMIYSYPDVLSYTTLRHPVFSSNEYEVKPETNKQDKHTRPGQKKGSGDSCKVTKDNCPICQERQRRPLAKYIKQKSKEEHTKDASIQEEEETTEVETKPTPQ